MKAFFALLLAFGMNVMIAQTKPVNVPKPVKTRFNTDYPNAVPNWSISETNYSAEYYDQTSNLGRTVIYDKNGSIVRIDNELGAGDFPTAIGDYYTQNFPDESYRVWSSEDPKGNRIYYGKQKDRTTWFDKNGKYLPEKPGKTTAKTKSKK